MSTAYINIGSNLGDSLSLTRKAAVLIGKKLGSEVQCADPVYSEAWGYESANIFVNLGISVEIGDMDPHHLLEMLHDIEQGISVTPHRNSDGSYRDRVIDIDLIAVDGITSDDEALVLPHPRMHMREFVLRPMVQLCPHWRHPLLGATAEELLVHLQSGGNNKK